MLRRMREGTMALEIPAGVQGLTPPWLTATLHEAGILSPDGSVHAAHVEVIGADRGIGGLVARVTPVYEGTSTGAPTTLIAKLPSIVEVTRGGGRFLRLPEREVRL